MAFTQDLFTSRRNSLDGNIRIGDTDRIWYDSNTNSLRIGNTLPGGRIIGQGSGGSIYYGSFYDITDQPIIAGNIAYTVSIGLSTESNGIDIDNNDIVFKYPGTYTIAYSLQLENTSTDQQDVNIWMRVNGINLDDSNSRFTVPPRKTSSIYGKLIAVTPITKTFQANDRATLMWHCDSTSVSIKTISAQTNPTLPRTPGVIVSVI